MPPNPLAKARSFAARNISKIPEILKLGPPLRNPAYAPAIYSQSKTVMETTRNIQKDIFKLPTFSKTYKQITEGQDQCQYCDYAFSVYTDHFLTECPANKTLRENLLTDNMHHITCTNAKVRAILLDQAQHNHKTLTQLFTKFPISQ